MMDGGTDLGPEELVHRQTAACGHQPAVTQLALDYVIAVDSVNYQTRVVADLLQTDHTQLHRTTAHANTNCIDDADT